MSICTKCGKEFTLTKVAIRKRNRRKRQLDLCEFCLKTKNRETTMLERYGAKTTMESPELRKKHDDTMMKKWKTIHALQIKDVDGVGMSKMNITCQEKFDANTPLESKIIQDKIRDTVQESYNVDYIMQNKDHLEKVRQGHVRKHGVRTPFERKEIHEKSIATFIKKYYFTL